MIKASERKPKVPIRTPTKHRRYYKSEAIEWTIKMSKTEVESVWNHCHQRITETGFIALKIKVRELK